MAKLVKSNLGYLGVDFQYKLISALVKEPTFFKDLSTIINQNVFTESYLRTIVGVMKDYYQKHDIVPSFDMLKIKLSEHAHNEDDLQYYFEAIDKLKTISSEGVDEIKDLSEKFFKQQNLIQVANKILKIAGDGDITKYDTCQKLVDDALAVGRKEDNASSPFDNIDEDLLAENSVSIPTGISGLDSCLGGGLDKGKIGLIMGSSGFGKTTMTTCIAANAAIIQNQDNDYQGYKILQIIFEDTQRDIHRKYFSKITQIETCKLNDNEETVELAKQLLNNFEYKDMMKNNIQIMRLPTGSICASDIYQKIKKKINEGFYPDLVIIDYFECLVPEKSVRQESEWNQEAILMRKFENMAHELDIAIWIPTQGNRGSFTSELVTMDQGGGSIKKQQIAQVVISITRSIDDIADNKATIAVLKNRSGKAGTTLNGVKFDNGTCTISCDEQIVFDDPFAYNDYVLEKEQEIHKNMISEITRN